MLRFVLRTGVFIFLGFWLKPRWKSLAALSFGILLIWIIHSEFLTYSVISDSSLSVGWSYVYKWAAIFFLVLLYFFLVELPLRAKGTDGAIGRSTSKLKKDRDNLLDSMEDKSAGKGDGFDFLRGKKNLKSRSQKILEE